MVLLTVVDDNGRQLYDLSVKEMNDRMRAGERFERVGCALRTKDGVVHPRRNFRVLPAAVTSGIQCQPIARSVGRRVHPAR